MTVGLDVAIVIPQKVEQDQEKEQQCHKVFSEPQTLQFIPLMCFRRVVGRQGGSVIEASSRATCQQPC